MMSKRKEQLETVMQNIKDKKFEPLNVNLIDGDNFKIIE